MNIDIDLIDIHPVAPGQRKIKDFDELVASIKEIGIMNHLLLSERGNGRYALCQGLQRYWAAKEIGLKTVPATIRSLTDTQILLANMVESKPRQEMSKEDRANQLEKFLTEVSKEEACRLLGIDMRTLNKWLNPLPPRKNSTDDGSRESSATVSETGTT